MQYAFDLHYFRAGQRIGIALNAVGFTYSVRHFGGWAVLEYGLIALSACAFLWLHFVVSLLNMTQQELLESAKNCTCFNRTNV